VIEGFERAFLRREHEVEDTAAGVYDRDRQLARVAIPKERHDQVRRRSLSELDTIRGQPRR
jgi:hypothetical protein